MSRVWILDVLNGDGADAGAPILIAPDCECDIAFNCDTSKVFIPAM